MSQASGTMKKLSLELGGNAPFLIFDDADVDQAVTGIVPISHISLISIGTLTSKFRATGQTCVSANRIFVQEGILPKYLEALSKKMQTIVLGSGFDEKSTAGPLIHGGAIKKVLEHVEDAKSKGAKVLLGGQALHGNFMNPTILTDMTTEMRIASEEIFGPVAAVFPFKTEEEAIKLANSTEFGLASYVYSQNIGRVWRVAEGLESGMVGVNTGLVSDAASPFGGVKESGFGKEGSKYGLDEYTVLKALTMGGMGLE
jgi:succinate-semialdehyde dehydrogenase / glutarate-semialdehyde dehydrogenase